MSKPTNLVQAIERAASILDTLGAHPRGISVGELSAKVNLPKGTTHRLLASLAYFGYVRRDAKTRRYSLGFKLVELGNRLLDHLDLSTEARPFLTELAERTRETVHLVVMDQGEIVYVDKVESTDSPGGLRMASRIGARTPAHSCAVGKVLLAHATEEELDAFIQDKGLVRMTDHTITDPAQLRTHLKSVRQVGYAVDDEENEQGIRCVAAPIRNERGHVIAAISISAPAIRVTTETIDTNLKREVMQTAFRISAKLGFRGDGGPTQ
jgi:DNA-binding IclR family transcriptional regulator